MTSYRANHFFSSDMCIRQYMLDCGHKFSMFSYISGEFHFLVEVQHFGVFMCGATIINPRFALTAKHCCADTDTESLKSMVDFRVRKQSMLLDRGSREEIIHILKFMCAD